MGKGGTNKATVSNEDPVLHLSRFVNNEELTDQETCQAEEYLVQVWTGTRKATAKTFDLLREEYICYSQGINGFSPTSRVVKGHICRGDFHWSYGIVSARLS